VRRGRKATGLREIAGLPGNCKGSRVAPGNRMARLFLWWIATLKQTALMEPRMEFKDLLIFVIMFVVAYVIYKILDKKMGP
jgi:hypothetical protein